MKVGIGGGGGGGGASSSSSGGGGTGVGVGVDVGGGCTAVHPVALVSSLSPSAIEIKASVVIPVSTLATALK